MLAKPLKNMSFSELLNAKRAILPIQKDEKHTLYKQGRAAYDLLEKEIRKRPEFKQLMKGRCDV
jgi:hypothetical protein